MKKNSLVCFFILMLGIAAGQTLSQSGTNSTTASKLRPLTDGEIGLVPATTNSEKHVGFIPDNPIEALKVKAEKGDAEAQFRLGRCYDDGAGIPKSFSDAASWYRKSAVLGFSASQFMLGDCLMRGEGVQQNLTEGVKWYRLSADQGFSPAQNNLGYCYEVGLGVSKDLAEAANWYRKAADKGISEAQSSLGDLFRRGEGVQQDFIEAVKLFQKAAEQNNALDRKSTRLNSSH